MTLHGLRQLGPQRSTSGRSPAGKRLPTEVLKSRTRGATRIWRCGGRRVSSHVTRRNVLPQACGLEQADSCSVVGDPFDHRRTHA
jgi:hypothetical protein